MICVPQITTTMTWFMLAMIAYLDKQRKCQEELESVVGRSRMPTLADQASLPYICATVRELLRWRPVIPVGKPESESANPGNATGTTGCYVGLHSST